MRYVSVFSGIEAASVAWMPLGWEAVAFSEIDAFPSAVLAERFPDVPNLGDITKIDWKEVIEEYGAVDLVVGGSPCQSFSVAGKRESLQPGAPSRLMFEYIRAISEIMPRWLVWENVPGCLSAKGLEGESGGAFRQLLRELGDYGYGLAWRIFDAQFFGVPQRRRRVFLVGCLGDPGRAAEVLFDSESMRWDYQSSRDKRASLAAEAGERAHREGCAAFGYHAGAKSKGMSYNTETSYALDTRHVPGVICASSQRQHASIEEDMSPTILASMGKADSNQPYIVSEVILSNGQDIPSAWCARDCLGVGSQYVTEGKVIMYESAGAVRGD